MVFGRRQPVISVDTKKKKLVGDFSNKGQEWRPKGDPEKVRAHDFVDKELGRATPYAIHDAGATNGKGGASISRRPSRLDKQPTI